MAHTIVHRAPVTGICIKKARSEKNQPKILFFMMSEGKSLVRRWNGHSYNRSWEIGSFFWCYDGFLVVSTSCMPIVSDDVLKLSQPAVIVLFAPMLMHLLQYGQKMKRTQVQPQRRMSLLRSMMTYHTKPAKTRNKESFSPVGPVYTRG
jgi:hypothetical protein